MSRSRPPAARPIDVAPSANGAHAPAEVPLMDAMVPAPSPPRPLAILAPDEMAFLKVAQDTIRQHHTTAELVQRGLTAWWAAIRDRYGLPAQFAFDFQSGVIFPAPVDGSPQWDSPAASGSPLMVDGGMEDPADG